MFLFLIFDSGSSSTEIGIILGVVFALLFLIVVIAFVLVILLRSRQGQYCGKSRFRVIRLGLRS